MSNRETLKSYTLRPIIETDAETIAQLHAQSWATAYRGILTDAFLDQDLFANRTRLWRQRLAEPVPGQFGLLASIDDQAAGFVFAFGDADPEFGTLIDNLHVHPTIKSQGLGRALLERLCEQARDIAADCGVFLWVYEDNIAARHFYEKLGGHASEREVSATPAGNDAASWRYVWPSWQDLQLGLRKR